MTTGGWIILLTSNLFVLVLCGWCIYKVVTVPGESEHIRNPKYEDPHDPIGEE